MTVAGRHARHWCLPTESSVIIECGRGQVQLLLRQDDFSSMKHLLLFLKRLINLFIHIVRVCLHVFMYTPDLQLPGGRKWVLESLNPVWMLGTAQVLCRSTSKCALAAEPPLQPRHLLVKQKEASSLNV